MSLRRGLVGAIVAAVLVATGSATAAPAPKSYKNCTAMNKVYQHGVGLKGARDKTSDDDPVTNFKVRKRVYQYNDGKAPRHLHERDLDRDNDRIACEKN